MSCEDWEARINLIIMVTMLFILVAVLATHSAEDRERIRSLTLRIEQLESH